MYIPSPSAGARQSSGRIVYMTTRHVLGSPSPRRALIVPSTLAAPTPAPIHDGHSPSYHPEYAVPASSPASADFSTLPSPRAAGIPIHAHPPLRLSCAPRCAKVPAHSLRDQQPRPCLRYMPWPTHQCAAWSVSAVTGRYPSEASALRASLAAFPPRATCARCASDYHVRVRDPAYLCGEYYSVYLTTPAGLPYGMY
ncbi:hypothetical protein C8J57DRAFT_1581309 [Mycena rebaudengoi]|nr:hypothetical protein C8J57DRAFT_1581309 [Mycena rebaudengoi]